MLAALIPKLAEAAPSEEHEYSARPSLAGPERCLRQLVYFAGHTRPDKDLPGRSLLVFDDGKWHEELTLDWLRTSAYQVHSEQMEVTLPYPMSKGHIDALVTDLMGRDYLLEHKGLNHFSFQRYVDGALPLDYLTQGSFYVSGIRDAGYDVAGGGLLLIKNKNTSSFLEISFDVDKAGHTIVTGRETSAGDPFPTDPIDCGPLIADAMSRFRSVSEHVMRQDLPARMAHGSWQCGYCRWESTCWQGYERAVEQRVAIVDGDDALAEAVRIYRLAKAAEKEGEKAKEIIRLWLDERDARGAAGAWGRVIRTVQKRETLDRSKIPPDILRCATKQTTSDVIRIQEAK